MLSEMHKGNKEYASEALNKLRNSTMLNQNIFEMLMEASKICSLGEITNTLFDVGGQYRRNM